MSMMVAQCKNQDELFNKTDVENDHLNYSIKYLNLYEDEECKLIVKENIAKAMKKAQNSIMF